MRGRLAVIAGFAAALTLGACGDDDDERAEKQATGPAGGQSQETQPEKAEREATRPAEGQSQAAQPISGHFIGKTADGRVAVAVLAERDGASRRVSVYVSDGKRVAEWFTSRTTANAVTLNSEDQDANVRLKLGKALATGTVEVSGRALRFRAPPRTAGEGLYLATITEGGYSARSPSGVRLTGRHTDATSKSTASFPDGRETPFTVMWSGHVRSDGSTLDRPPPGQYRWIVTEGQFFGAINQPTPSNFIDPPHE